jgi:heme o synthase
VTAVALAVGRRAATIPWRDVLVLLKLRIAGLIVMVALSSAVAAGTTEPATLALLAAACLAAASGAGALNHWLDRDLDARMARTAARPLPSGRIGDARVALWLGAGLLAASQLAVFALGWAVCLYLLAGAATYVVVYTWWLKPRSPWSVVWGGAAGSFAALAGWQTGGSAWSPAAQLLALVLFLWTPSHFWSLAIWLERDYRAARIPMLPVVAGTRRTAEIVHLNTAALVVCSLALGAYLGWPYLAVAAPAGVWFLWVTARVRRSPESRTAFACFKLSGLYLLLVLAGLVLSAVV